MISKLWSKPLIQIDKKDNFYIDDCYGNLDGAEFDSIKLEDSVMESKDNCEDCFHAYDNMLFSGSNFTGDKLMSKENDILDKFK